MREAQQQASSGQCVIGVCSRRKNTSHSDVGDKINVNEMTNVNRQQQKNWVRARSFKCRTEAEELVKIIDRRGDEMWVEVGTQLHSDRHKEVVATLTDRACQISNRM